MSIEVHFPQALQDAFRTRSTFAGDGSQTGLHSNISEAEAAQLYRAVRAARPGTSAEIGFAQGISTAAILQGLADNGHGFHHVIDPFQSRFLNAGLAMVGRAGLGSWMQFYEKFPEEVMPQLPPLDFVFIDASHLFDLTILDFVLADKKLAPGGLVVFHDTWMPSIRKVIRHILSNRDYAVRHDYNPTEERVRGFGSRLQNRIAPVLRRVPGAERIFSQEALRPWGGYGLGNLVILQKMKNDGRDWQFYAPF
jgi:predicted O-methyltransferase YrrM